MRIRNNYIFFFLIFLSLFGLGNDLSISKTNIRYLKETEWISKSSPKIKASKCFHFQFDRVVDFSSLTKQIREKEFLNSFNRKLNVLFLFQTRLFGTINIINIIPSKIFDPRLSIDDDHFSYRSTEFINHICASNWILIQVRNFKCDHLFNRKWINQKSKLNAKGKDVLDGCQTGSL